MLNNVRDRVALSIRLNWFKNALKAENWLTRAVPEEEVVVVATKQPI
jgi:hypothetical protein